KGPVAARPRRRMPPSPGGTRRSIPSTHAPAFRGSHSSAPHNECQGGKTKRPPDEEAEDHERNPGWFSQLIKLCNDWHRWPRSVNVNHIYMAFQLLVKGVLSATYEDPAPSGGTVRPKPRR